MTGAAGSEAQGAPARPASLRTLGIATAVSLGLYALLLALTWAGLGAPRDALLQQVRAGFATGQLLPDASWQHGDTDIGAHQYNDCLILYQALDDRAPRLARAVSPLSVPVDTDYACARLETLVTAGPDAPPRHYQQYLHAQTTLARALVSHFGVRGTRELYRLALSLTLLAGIAWALLDLVRGRREGLLWLIVFLGFARWFGLESFGQSLGHAPADLVLIGWLLWLSRATARGPIGLDIALLAAAVLGALTMATELLTGGLPLGLAATLGLLPLTLAPAAVSVRTIAHLGVSYLIAALAMAAAKLAAILFVFGAAPIAATARQFLFRTGVAGVSIRDEPADAATFFRNLWAGLDAPAPGMQLLVFGMLLIGTTAGAWGYRLLRAAPDPAVRLRAQALLASCLVVPLWLVVFWQHTAEHAWFIDRIWVWPPLAGFLLFALALVIRDPAPAAPDTPAA